MIARIDLGAFGSALPRRSRVHGSAVGARVEPVLTVTEIPLPDDDLLMSHAKDGSVDAFEEIYDRYCDRAYRVAQAICHDQRHAEAAIQEAFHSVWKNRASYRPQRGTVAAWLLTTVSRQAIDIVRRSHNHADRQALADHLRAPFIRLPDDQREAIALAYYGKLTHTEIATALDLPAATVQQRMRLGLQKFRTNIQGAPPS